MSASGRSRQIARIRRPRNLASGPRAPAYSPPCCPGSVDAGVRRSEREQSRNAQAQPSTLRTHRSRLESRVMGEFKERTIGKHRRRPAASVSALPLVSDPNQRRIRGLGCRQERHQRSLTSTPPTAADSSAPTLTPLSSSTTPLAFCRRTPPAPPAIAEGECM